MSVILVIVVVLLIILLLISTSVAISPRRSFMYLFKSRIGKWYIKEIQPRFGNVRVEPKALWELQLRGWSESQKNVFALWVIRISAILIAGVVAFSLYWIFIGPR